MTAEGQSFTIYEGEDKTVNISVTDSDGGSPVNLGSPTSVTWQVKYSASTSTAALIEKTYADGEISIANDAGTNDQLQIALDAADSQGLEGAQYYHECRVVDGSADNHVVTSGYMTVKHSATG
mgnify:FL=1